MAKCHHVYAIGLLDQGKLIVAHAKLKEQLHGQASRRMWDCLYGNTTGEVEYGLSVRLDRASEYHARAGGLRPHATALAHEVNKTICIDIYCVFGGKLRLTGFQKTRSFR